MVLRQRTACLAEASPIEVECGFSVVSGYLQCNTERRLLTGYMPVDMRYRTRTIIQNSGNSGNSDNISDNSGKSDFLIIPALPIFPIFGISGNLDMYADKTEARTHGITDRKLANLLLDGLLTPFVRELFILT